MRTERLLRLQQTALVVHIGRIGDGQVAADGSNRTLGVDEVALACGNAHLLFGDDRAALAIVDLLRACAGEAEGLRSADLAGCVVDAACLQANLRVALNRAALVAKLACACAGKVACCA